MEKNKLLKKTKRVKLMHINFTIKSYNINFRKENTKLL